MKGNLKLFVNEKVIFLSEGKSFTILTNRLHWAEGNEVWIDCYSTPGWTCEDHIVEK